MNIRQVNVPDLPVSIELRSRTATVHLKDQSIKETFQLQRVEDLTARKAEAELLPRLLDAGSRPLLVSFNQASDEARQLLRQRQISFIADDGECFIFAPPLIVDRAPRRTGRHRFDNAPDFQRWSGARNPFALRASRVIRWLLLHPGEDFAIRQLATAVDVSEALTSRAIRSLEEAAMVEARRNPEDARSKRVRIRKARQALSAWRNAWEARRLQTLSWDIGTTTPEQTFQSLARAKEDQPQLTWAIGGLAGAGLIRRAVEPADVLLWVRRDQVDLWERELLPNPVSRARASIRLNIAPDDFIFRLKEQRGDLWVADRAQLWLDCSIAGERALEAAEAIAEEMGW